MAVLEKIPHECPRCGGDVVLVDSEVGRNDLHENKRREYMVLCPQCMYGSRPGCDTREEALRSWEDTKELMCAEDDLRRNKG